MATYRRDMEHVYRMLVQEEIRYDEAEEGLYYSILIK